MGNANGREEDGGENPSEMEEPGAAQVSMADQEGAHGVEYVGQSPPTSPRVSQTPLMFRPQMPVVPLQRPNELQIPNPSWMQTSWAYEEACDEQCIPTMITWSYGGKEVAIEGSWDDWKSRRPLQRSGKDFTIMRVLPSGVYRYRFLVDGQWRHSPDQPWEYDDSGNAFNILDLQCFYLVKLLELNTSNDAMHIGSQRKQPLCIITKEYVPEDIDSISGFDPPQSPESSYNNLQLSQEDFAKEPPMVPPHLNSTLLNAPSPQMEILPPYSRPQHVVLNHLYMHRDRNRPSVVALGSTNRFLSKYVTVVIYKSIQR